MDGLVNRVTHWRKCYSRQEVVGNANRGSPAEARRPPEELRSDFFYALPVITRNIAFIVFNKIIFPLPSLPLQLLLLHRLSSRHLAVYSSTYTLAAAQCKHGNTGTDLDSVFNPWHLSQNYISTPPPKKNKSRDCCFCCIKKKWLQRLQLPEYGEQRIWTHARMHQAQFEFWWGTSLGIKLHGVAAGVPACSRVCQCHPQRLLAHPENQALN